MQSVELSIFRFCAQEGYEYYFQKHPIAYDASLTLFDALESIPDLGFDKSMGLRVQGLCVLDDVRVQELVGCFGECLYIEPLSQKYVKKDLQIDKDAMARRYEGFFAAHDFIDPSDRYELHKYLWANCISLRDDSEYLGDGFFLYMHWLLGRYPKHFDTLIHALAGAQSGVMSYVPLEALIYKPKPDMRAITPIMENLIDKVARFGVCQGCGCAWISQLDSMRPKPLTQRQILHLASLESKESKESNSSPESSPAHGGTESGASHTSGHISINESNDVSSDERRAIPPFMLFDAYTLSEAAPMIASSRALIKALGFRLIDPREFGGFVSFGAKSGNYYAHIIEPEIVIERILYNLILAHKAGASLVFGDLESYAYAKWALQALYESSALCRKIEQRFAALKPQNAQATTTAAPESSQDSSGESSLASSLHELQGFATLLESSVLFIGDLITRSSARFSLADSALAGCTLATYPSELLDSIITLTSERNNLLGLREPILSSTPKQNPKHPSDVLLKLISLAHTIKTPAQKLAEGLGNRWLKVLECTQDFSHLRAFNEEAYLTQSARVRFACIDSGADVIVISSVGQFRAFTTHASRAAASIGRDNVQIPILYPAQLALLALGRDAKCDSSSLRQLERA